MIVFLNGQFLSAEEAKISITDHGFLYGDGVYETLRTYQGKVWQVKAHLRRLEKSAYAVSLKLPATKKQIGEWLEKVVRLNGFKESRIRITLTRGMNSFDFVHCKNPTFLIQVQELKPEPSSVYNKGVKVITVHFERLRPEIKSISLLPFIVAQQEIAKQQAYEALYVDTKKYVREGTITNVFIIKKGKLWTPKNNILFGTTREFILKFAAKTGIKVFEKDFKLADLYKADEVFITNAPRGIIPVRMVDKKLIGTGKVGQMTKSIREEFKLYVEGSHKY